VGNIIKTRWMATRAHLARAARLARFARFGAAALAALLCLNAQAAAPGITGTTFDLSAEANRISQPDGSSVYAWGYGCRTAPSGFSPAGTVPACRFPGRR